MYLGDAPQPASAATALPDGAFVMLDPAVERLDAEIAGFRFLAHGHFDTGMAIPPGDGLLDVIADMTGAPVEMRALRRGYSDRRLIDAMVATLHAAGFVHVTSPKAPSDAVLAALRTSAAQRRNAMLRPVVTLDLGDGMTADQVCRAVTDAGRAPDLILRGAALAQHAPLIEALAHARAVGDIRIHRIEIRTDNAVCDAPLCRTLRRIGAAVVIEGVAWPAPQGPVPGVAALTRHGVAVQAQMTADRSICDPQVRARAIAWVTSAYVAGLRLRIDANAIPSAPDECDALFDFIDALEEAIGDVLVETLPSDAVILGRVASARPAAAPPGNADRFRRAYLRRRIPFLKACEGDNSWSQTPEAEEKLVRPDDDLLPNNPDLLSIGPGSILVDVCGGLGRVARRLAPAVGPDGVVLSFEMLRCVSDRARAIACDRGFTNVQFRPGLAQRIPLPDGAADAAVNEWTGAIWELGIGPAMIAEMQRVVRVGGRIAVTHRLVRLPLSRLREPWVQYDEIYGWVRSAFDRPDLTIVAERVWGQIAPSMIGEPASQWRKQYLPCAVDPHDFTYAHEAHEGPHADVYLTIIAEIGGR
ncbi:class I SAM-dependent methyltransferase [Sphingomonas sp. PB2P19]|uniref:methyltransferase domain-containing protein n=1 Tax=Sphingomonas rhamnosi TaxID=3096156 RepID=UPI002FC9697F